MRDPSTTLALSRLCGKTISAPVPPIRRLREPEEARDLFGEHLEARLVTLAVLRTNSPQTEF